MYELSMIKYKSECKFDSATAWEKEKKLAKYYSLIRMQEEPIESPRGHMNYLFRQCATTKGPRGHMNFAATLAAVSTTSSIMVSPAVVWRSQRQCVR